MDYARRFGPESAYASIAEMSERLKKEKFAPFRDADMRSLLVGVRSGLPVRENLPEAARAAVEQTLKESGIEVIGLFAVDAAALERRAAEEPEIAALVGWDAGQSLAENLAGASVGNKSTAMEKLKAFFVFGYPSSTLRGYKRQSDLHASGLPLPERLEMLGTVRDGKAGESILAIKAAIDAAIPDGRVSDTLTVDQALDVIAAAAKTEEDAADNYMMENGDMPPLAEQLRLKNERSAAVAPVLSALYRRAFGASEDDAAFMASRRALDILTPDGGEAFNLGVYEHLGYGGAAAADVVALQEKMARQYPKK
ncbi:MAG: hypothetical protein RLZZ324_847 [Candidatus Parcubacteria bacterium]